MLETPHVSWWYSSTVGTLTTLGSDNPQATRTISREVLSRPGSQLDSMTPQRLHADALATIRGVLQAYLQGALHDGTRSNLHKTHRIVQKGKDWLDRLQHMLRLLSHSSWIYREGRTRDEMYVLESSAKFFDVDYDLDRLATDADRVAYVRGYFDAEGGMPRQIDFRPFQIQLVQKDRDELERVRTILTTLGIHCGRMHNPSRNADPDYWRFYISAASVTLFARVIGSWHPRKERLLGMMI